MWAIFSAVLCLSCTMCSLHQPPARRNCPCGISTAPTPISMTCALSYAKPLSTVSLFTQNTLQMQFASCVLLKSSTATPSLVSHPENLSQSCWSTLTSRVSSPLLRSKVIRIFVCNVTCFWAIAFLKCKSDTFRHSKCTLRTALVYSSRPHMTTRAACTLARSTPILAQSTASIASTQRWMSHMRTVLQSVQAAPSLRVQQLSSLRLNFLHCSGVTPSLPLSIPATACLPLHWVAVFPTLCGNLMGANQMCPTSTFSAAWLMCLCARRIAKCCSLTHTNTFLLAIMRALRHGSSGIQ